MDNYFLSLKEQTQINKSNSLSPEQKKNKTDQLALRAKQRIETWINETDISVAILETLKKGTIPLKHIALHNFRDRDKNKEIDPLGITVKTFQTSKERASLRSNYLLSLLPSRQEYLENNAIVLRERDIAKEINYPMRFGLKNRLENERISEDLQKNRSLLDYTASDLKMRHRPEWKVKQKEKWMSNSDFLTKNQSHLPSPSVLLPPPSSSAFVSYQGGFEVTGDLSRKRNKALEGKKPEFIGMVPNDVWGRSLGFSMSIRTMKGEEEGKGEGGSTMMFEHSNNKNGAPLRDLKPTFPKIYWKSVASFPKNPQVRLESEKSTISKLVLNSKSNQNTNTMKTSTLSKHSKKSFYVSKEEKIESALATYFS